MPPLLEVSSVSNRNALRIVLALLVSALFLLPLAFMVSGSLRNPDLPPPRTPELLPQEPTLENYERAFELVDLARYTLNSVIVVALAVPLTLLVASWAGFAMARLPARARAWLVAISLVSLMVPITALLVPRFALFSWFGLTNTYVPLVAPALIGTSPFYVLLFYWAFRRIPAELYEACRLEGLSPFTVWWRVALPLVRPVTVAVAVLAAVFTWSNFLDPLIYLFDESLFTLPLGLKALAQLDRQDFPVLLAASVIATAPVVLGFLCVQRFFLRTPGTGWWLGR
jgi:multiple sugar transport system permease protein